MSHPGERPTDWESSQNRGQPSSSRINRRGEWQSRQNAARQPSPFGRVEAPKVPSSPRLFTHKHSYSGSTYASSITGSPSAYAESDAGTSTSSGNKAPRIECLGSLFTFFIFDTQLEARDEDADNDEILQEILYFYPSDVDDSMQIKLLSYCKTVIDISKVFCSEPARRHQVYMDKRRVVMRELEPGIWGAMFLTISELTSAHKRLDRKNDRFNSNGSVAKTVDSVSFGSVGPSSVLSVNHADSYPIDHSQLESVSRDDEPSVHTTVWEQHPSAEVLQAKMDDWHSIFMLFYGSMRRSLSHPAAKGIIGKLFYWRKYLRKLMDEMDKRCYNINSNNEQSNESDSAERMKEDCKRLKERLSEAITCSKQIVTVEALSPLVPVRRTLASMYDFLLFYTDISRLTPLDELDTVPVGRVDASAMHKLHLLTRSIKRKFSAVSNAAIFLGGYGILQDDFVGLSSLYKFFRLYSEHLFSRRYQPPKRNFLKFGELQCASRRQLENRLHKLKEQISATNPNDEVYTVKIVTFCTEAKREGLEPIPLLLSLAIETQLSHSFDRTTETQRQNLTKECIEPIRKLNSHARTLCFWDRCVTPKDITKLQKVFSAAKNSIHATTLHGYDHKSANSTNGSEVMSSRNFHSEMLNAPKPASGCPARFATGYYRTQKQPNFHVVSDHHLASIVLPSLSIEYLDSISMLMGGFDQHYENTVDDLPGGVADQPDTSIFNTVCPRVSNVSSLLCKQACHSDASTKLFCPVLFAKDADSLRPSHRCLWYQHGEVTILLQTELSALSKALSPWEKLGDICAHLVSSLSYHACRVNLLSQATSLDKQRLPQPVFTYRHVVPTSTTPTRSMGRRTLGFGATFLSGLGPRVTSSKEARVTSDTIFRQLSPALLTSWIEGHYRCSYRPVPEHMAQYEHDPNQEDFPGIDRQSATTSSRPRHYFEVLKKGGAVLSIRDGSEELYMFLGKGELDYNIGGAEAVNIMGGMRGRFKGVIVR